MRSQYTIDPYYDSPEWRELRRQVLDRDHSTCFYCHGPAHQADHVVPRKKGGKDRVHNLVACCATCNRTAGNRVFKNRETKKKWVNENRPPTEDRCIIHHDGPREKKPEYATKTKNKSLFRKKLESRLGK